MRRTLPAVAATLTALLVAGLVLAPSAAADTATVLSTKDQHVRSKYPNNVQPGGTLHTKGANNDTMWAYLGFTVSEIPAGATNVTARLEVYADFAVAATSRVHWANNTFSAAPGGDWTETALAWNNKPDPAPTLSTQLATHAATVAAGWVGYDVTGLINRNGTFTMLLRTDGTGQYQWQGDEQTNRPRLVLSWTPPSATTAPRPAPDFADEFDGSTINTAVWDLDYPWDLANDAWCRQAPEQQCYEPGQVRVSGGQLHLVAEQANPPRDANHPFKSGMITTCKVDLVPSPDICTGRAFTRGYFEISAKLTNAGGSWPAFWLLPTDMTDSVPELDVMEELPGGGDPTNHICNYHYVGGDAGTDPAHIGPGKDSGFHRYAMRWTTDRLECIYDGTVFRTISTPAPPNEPMYLLVNLAVGTSSQAPDPAGYPESYDIDYVRVWNDPAVSS